MYNENQLYDHQAMDSLRNGTRRFQSLSWDPLYFILIPGESHVPSDPEHTIETVKNRSTENRPMIRGFCQRSTTLRCMFHLNSANRFFRLQHTFCVQEYHMQLVIYESPKKVGLGESCRQG